MDKKESKKQRDTKNEYIGIISIIVIVIIAVGAIYLFTKKPQVESKDVNDVTISLESSSSPKGQFS
ncbi:hypothetical protein [Legionella maioricensis]|uniref:Uncharacterized protein n=1 Tax=Legionella maioricensis TaxID=2896528 RepID=A0A9X2D2G5_9GAMM|nr:hypothetical protein [Legionella maioricensis]MCL9684825.1 hypothetical protein [Legionella maioricensis]MCL9688505.1 hypothetical protein [Legionella maioricensis]